ncbi:thiamine-phosphate pyrophosphorylase [Gillisia sp. Hel_I_86]|uniref:thiamine phosphate synthase n=1 Tax=Gillisia sp. Hel_I_86 TaxID=1249981 RepID=UPI00119A00DB|nr:thiamine phosphate synthase [Gillisia sp. Hel_I_86]TVZ26352.1 thiamine-phosphate pyrophosphorylase [Gillisia sp. Hel_I_86]
MLILLTSEKSNNVEKEQLIQFFENGLQLLHVRKPEIKEKELKAWLAQFEAEQQKKMVLHQHHHLAEAFLLKGVHLKESFRRNLKDVPEYIKQFNIKGCTVSASFHDPKEVSTETSLFDYVFLSPLFSSISKSGYKGRGYNVEALQQKIVALGGIEAENISKAKELGYAGVAVLGAVWLKKNKPKAFVEIYNEYQNVYN